MTVVTARSAYVSPCGTYRYHLSRQFQPRLFDHRIMGEHRRLLAVMVNPSTADAEKDDPTIRKLVGFAQHPTCVDGFDTIEVVNLFAYRATDVSELLRCEDAHPHASHPLPGDAVGPENDRWIHQSAERATRILVAWGAKSGRLGTLVRKRAERVIATLRAAHTKPLLCVGTSKSGDPLHPLMAKYGPFVPWKGWP